MDPLSLLIGLAISLGIGAIGGTANTISQNVDAKKNYQHQYGTYSKKGKLSQDEFNAGTYYTYDKSTGQYVKATSYSANEKYYTQTEEGTIDKERNQALETLEENYQTEKEEVNQNATLSEDTLNGSATLAFDNLINQMSGQAAEFNSANMQIGQSEGNELSTMAASGARTSSMAQAVDLEKSVNSAQLDLQEQQTRTNNNYEINSFLNNFASEKAGLQQSRLSFETGGTAYKKYQTSVNSLNNSYDNSLSDLAYEYQQYKKSGFSRWLSSTLGSTSSAFSVISSIDTSKVNWNNFNTSGNNGLLSSNWNTNFDWNSNLKGMSYLYGNLFK